MSLETAKELISFCIEIGVKHFYIIGGEPTLWTHLFELNRYCKSLGVTTGLITNAAQFGNDDFWEKYQESPCDNISVSIKSTDPIQFREVTKAKIYNQTMKGVARAISLPNSGISTVYNSLVGLDGLKNIATTCRQLGAKFITIDLCTPTITENEISEDFSIEPHQLAKDIMELQPFLNDLYDGNIEIETFIPLCLFPTSFIEKMLAIHQIGTTCHVYTRSGLNFNTNGDIMPCNQMFETIIAKKGTDFTDGPSLLRHLNNDELRKEYRELLRYPSTECNNCRWENECRGGCLINWMVFDPSICHTIPKTIISERR
jgi:radical SAM protein with 4Fe4S-binding SPASM domain